MTLEELRDRIKNEVVLYEGELADWQWRQKGLVAEANDLGITDFTRLVNDISRQVNRDFGKILDLKKKIVTVALQRQNKLSDADISQFIAEAERVQLSPAFVTQQWIPAILAILPESATPELTASSSGNAGSETATPKKELSNPSSPEPAPVTEKVEAVRRKIKSILDDYDKHIQAQSLNFLFKAVDYEEAELAEEIRQYLSEHYYASVNPPRGNTLREKLISTDWRHLSWWEKQQAEPAGGYVKTPTGYSTPPVSGGADLSSRPPAAPGPNTQKPPQVVPPVQLSESPKKSGLSDAAIIGLSVLTVMVLVWIAMWFVRINSSGSQPQKPEKVLEKPSPKTGKSKSKLSKSQLSKKKPDISKEETIGVINYDEIDDRVGEFGLRPARRGKLWGYINDSDKWIIKPQFDLAAPFNFGKASVELDGVQFFIDRYGTPISTDN